MHSHHQLLQSNTNTRSAPASLTLAFGTKSLGMDYDRGLFGMQLADCRSLARTLAHTETLVHLDL